MNAKDVMARNVASLHEALYRSTAGMIGGWLGLMPVLLLTTTGRKTGEERTTPLTYLQDGDRVVLVASYGGDDRHPSWYLNLTANPQVKVTRGSRTDTMTARTASPQEKAELWPQVVRRFPGYAAYQRNTQRDIPLVILTRGDAG